MAISSAIVPYKGNKSSTTVEPKQSLVPKFKFDSVTIAPKTGGGGGALVKTEKKESVDKAEITAKDIRRSVLMLLRKRQQRDRLEEKFSRLKKVNKEKESIRKEESKQEKSSFLNKTGIGSNLKGKAEKLGGNLLGAIGDILGYMVLDWMSKPENQAILTGIVEGVKHIFAFIDWWVTGSVDNLLTGFSNLVGQDKTLLERVLGFFQMMAGVFGLRYFLKPQLIFKDLWKIAKFIKGGGIRKIKIFFKKLQKQGFKKAFKFAFPKLSKVIKNIVGIGPKILKAVKNVFAKTGVGGILSKIANAILKSVGGKTAQGVLKKAVGVLIKPVTGFLKRIPVVGGLLSFGLNMLLGDPPDQAFIKAAGSMLGSAIGAGLGSFIFPGVGTWLGGLVGGLIGDWLGDRLYDMLKGGDAKPPTEEEKRKLELKRQEVEEAKRITGGTDRALTVAEQQQIYDKLAAKHGMSPEKVKALLEQKEVDLSEDGDDDTSNTGATISGGDIPPAGSNAKALLNTIRYAEGTSGPQGYNTWFGGRTDMDLTKMTINEVVAEQQRRLSNGEATYGKYTSAAVGAYQMMKPEVFAIKAGFDPATTKFTPEVQDQMAIAGYMKGQAQMTQAEIDAPINRQQIAKMAPVWASLPMMNGKSRYNQPVKSFETLQAVYNKSLAGTGGDRPARITVNEQPKVRSREMRDISMSIVQFRKHAHLMTSPNVTVIKTGDVTVGNFTSVTSSGRLNSNNVVRKRGL